MLNPRRLLLRTTTAITIAALLFALLGVSAWRNPVPVYGAPLALVPADITANMVSYWKLDEASGNRNDTHGIYGYTPTGSVVGTTGKINNAAAISVDANYLNAGDFDPISVDSSHDFALSAWLNFNSQSTNQNIIISKAASASTAEFFLRYLGSLNGADYLQFAVGSDSQTVMATGTPISNGVWYFVVAWQQQGVIGIQVNNGTVYTATAGTSYSYGSAGFKIGNNIGGGSISFDGLVDEVGFWKSAPGAGGALSADIRTALYNAGAGCPDPFAGCVGVYTPTPPATPTTVAPSGNLIRNPSFTVAPHQPAAFWADLNRVVQSPYSDSGLPIEHMPYGSCGEEYWAMGTTGSTDGSIYQDFGWSGGPMYINFEALTDSYVTIGHATLLNRGTGEEQDVINFTNGSMAWRTFKTTIVEPAGQYRLGFSYEGFTAGAGLAVDNVNVRRNYWANDCPMPDYHGDLPTTTNATAAAVASPTPPGGAPNAPVNSNCDFEQGWAGDGHNQGARLVSTGGAVGPTYAYLFTVFQEPLGPDLPGRVYIPYDWPGGPMYVSWWTGPGTNANITVRNFATGFSRQIQTSAATQSFDGWIKHSYGGFSAPAGHYMIDASSPWGQVAALDGVAVASGGFASGPCATQNTSGDNNVTATAHAANTQSAGTATNNPAAINTANAQATEIAGAYGTYVTGAHATGTQLAHATQTRAVQVTQTAAVNATATRHAQETATAQGTPAPTATLTPQPIPTNLVCTLERPIPPGCVQDPPTVAAPGPDDMTQHSAEQTQSAIAIATFFAAAQATANARAAGTQAAIQTAVATQHAVQTQAAASIQTAVALHATQTAVVDGLNALATQQALSTQHAQQAAATQTAAAQQTTVAGGGPTQQAEATSTAQAYATQYAGVTATAQAQQTVEAIATVNAQATQHSQATANSAATAVSLATQQAGQSQATATAVALQTQLATQANATANAAATTTAVAVATTVAQTTATAQVAATNNAATQQASGTTVPGGGDGDLPPVDDRPEPSPGADCERPDSPLEVANWFDYETCRVLTWFAWSPDNTDQLLDIESQAADSTPFGLFVEIGDTLGVFGSWLGSLPWCDTGFCQDQPLAPLNLEASGILNGDFDFADGTPYYSDQCTLLMGPLLGPGIQSGMCFCVNVLCALGILPWFQLVVNFVLIVMLLVYVRQTWLMSAP